MTTQNILRQQKNESLEAYIARIRNMNNEELQEASEAQRTAVLESYRGTTKQSSYKRKVYHK